MRSPASRRSRASWVTPHSSLTFHFHRRVIPAMSSTASMQQRANDFRQAYNRLKKRDRQGHRRPRRHRPRRPDLPVRRRPCPARRRARPGQDAAGAHAQPGARPEFQPHPVHARPDAVRHHRHQHHQRNAGRQARLQLPDPARSSPRSCWPTKSTGPRRKRSRPCWKPCRNTASPSAAPSTSWKSRSS